MFPGLFSTRFRPRLYRPGNIGNWSGHLPLAADLVDALRPSLFVELGTHHGESYFGFCQAIQELGIKCQAFAVDLWKGDSQSGYYGPSVLKAVSAYNSERYPAFSSLLPMSFDEASARFQDGTIDLLNMDGCHTYEAARHDFANWLPKVSAGGIVLMHDIAVRDGDFGAWRFWDEISRRFPSFAFAHSCGLGILANTTAREFENPLLAALLGGASDPEAIRAYYILCAERLSYADSCDTKRPTTFKVFWPDETGSYAEERSEAASVSPENWVSLDLETPASPGRLRLIPANCRCSIEISELRVECPSTGRVLWRLDTSRMDEIITAGTVLCLPDKDRLIVLSSGNDPQLCLPYIAASESETLRLRCCLRIDRDFRILEQILIRQSDASAR
jgi:hypothetical protein